MTQYNMDSGKWVCECCGEYTEEDKRKVHMHEVRCKQKAAGAEEPLSETVPEEEGRKREEPARKERVPFGVPRQRFHFNQEDGYEYRVFNDNWAKEPGRVQRALAAGYEVVQDAPTLAVGTNEDNTPIKGVLMRIPKELYEEDQKLKQKENDRVDEAIRKGTLDQKAGEERYVPQGIKIWSSNNEQR